MMMRRAVPALIGCVLALAACDTTTEPVPGTPGVDPAVALVLPLDDLAIDRGAVAAPVDLDRHFNSNAEAGGRSYTATATDPAVGVAVGGSTLRVEGVAEGAASVVVVARGAAGGEAADTFAVEVRSPAPPGPGPGEADFLPVAPGTVWAYDYRYEGPPCGQIRTTRRGTLRLSFEAETVGGGRRVVTGTAALAYVERRVDTAPTPMQVDSSAVEQTYAVRAVETAEGVQLDPIGEIDFPLFERYHPATDPEVRVADGLVTWTQRAGTAPTRGTTTGSCGTGYPATDLSLPGGS